MKFNTKKIVLFFITVIFLLLIFFNLNFEKLINEIKLFDIKYVLLLIISIVISLSFRGLCFKLLISNTVKPPLKELIPLCLTGAALNIFLPVRAGDIFRAYYVGSKYDVDKIKILGAVILERIFDGVIIVFILFLGIFLFNRNELALNLLLAASILFTGGFFAAFVIFRFNKTDVICDFLNKKVQSLPNVVSKVLSHIIKFINNISNSFISGFEVFKYPRKLLFVILSVLGIWIFECLCYYITILGFHLEVNWSVILFIISFIALASMIPSTSIFIGPYQVAVICAFAIYDISKETAIAVSLVEQAIVTLTVSITGAIFLIKNNISYKEIKNK